MSDAEVSAIRTKDVLQLSGLQRFNLLKMLAICPVESIDDTLDVVEIRQELEADQKNWNWRQTLRFKGIEPDEFEKNFTLKITRSVGRSLLKRLGTYLKTKKVTGDEAMEYASLVPQLRALGGSEE